MIPGADDEATHGMQMYRDDNALMPCHECLITGYVPNVEFADGVTANANNGIYLHHIGLGNLNRTDAACDEWPDRWVTSGNERSLVDLTIGG